MMTERDDALEDDEPMIITQTKFARRTGFARSTISRWVADGTLPTFTVNGKRYIRRDLAMAWLDQHTSGGRPPEDDG